MGEFVKCIYQSDILELYRSLHNAKYKPLVKLFNTQIQSITMMNIEGIKGRFNLSVQLMISDHVKNLTFENIDEYNHYTKADHEFANNLLIKNFKSNYNEQVRKMLNKYVRANARWNLDDAVCGYSFDFQNIILIVC